MNKLIASVFGLGYLKGGASAASSVTCIIVWFTWHTPFFHNSWLLLFITVVLTFLGIYVGNKVEAEWGKDSKHVVIDEVAGMLVTLLFIPADIKWLIIGFMLFRLFDNLKPLYIKKMENFKGGWGVMLDDLLAGLYSNITLWLIVFITNRISAK